MIECEHVFDKAVRGLSLDIRIPERMLRGEGFFDTEVGRALDEFAAIHKAITNYAFQGVRRDIMAAILRSRRKRGDRGTLMMRGMP